jgi:chromosome partitioning protein
MKTIALAMPKGGTAKTTTCINLAAALVELGWRVCAVDLDPQGNLTACAGWEPDPLDQTIYQTIVSTIRDGRVAPPPILVTKDGFDLIPANLDLSLAELDLQSTFRREYILARILARLEGDYDFVMLDCPPSLGILVVNALTAAQTVLIPTQAEFLAARGIDRLLQVVERVRATELNPDLGIAGILLTMADRRTIHTRKIINVVRQAYGDLRVFETVIYRSVRFAESTATGRSILHIRDAKEQADAYRALAREVLSNG